LSGRRESDDIQDQVKFLKSHVGKMSWGARLAALTVIGSLIGTLYGGFQIWLKVEELASLDIGAYQAQMEQTDNKIETQGRLLESIEQNLRDAKQLIYDVEKRVNDKVVHFENKMDKFEAKVEQNRADLEDKLQKALDNPLSGN